MLRVEPIPAVLLHKLNLLAALPPTTPLKYVGFHSSSVQTGSFGYVADVQFDGTWFCILNAEVEPVAVSPSITIAPDETVELIGFDTDNSIQIAALERRIKLIGAIMIFNYPPS